MKNILFLFLFSLNGFSQQDSVVFDRIEISLPEEYDTLSISQERLILQSDMGTAFTLSYGERINVSESDVVDIANLTIVNLNETLEEFLLEESNSLEIGNTVYYEFLYKFKAIGESMQGQMLFASVKGELLIISISFLNSSDKKTIIESNRSILKTLRVK